MTTTKTIGLTLCVGITLGLLAGLLVARHSMVARWGREGYARRLDRFSRELALTPDQRRQVAVILEDKRKKIEVLRSDVRPRFEEIRMATNAEIRKVLLPAQQAKFEQMQGRQAARARKWRSESGAP